MMTAILLLGLYAIGFALAGWVDDWALFRKHGAHIERDC